MAEDDAGRVERVERGGASGELEGNEFTGIRIPPQVLAALRQRYTEEDISLGEMVTYLFWRVSQAERESEGWDAAAKAAWVDELRAWRGNGDLGRWVQSWVSPGRARQIHPATPPESGDGA